MFTRYKNLITLNDYKKVKNQGIIEGDSLTPGTYKFNETNRVMRVNGSNSNYFRVPIGNLLVGDIINVKCMAKKVAGNTAEIWVSHSNSNFDTNSLGKELLESINKNDWYMIDNDFILNMNSKQTSLIFGYTSENSGIFELKDVEITVKSKIKDDEMRRCSIKKEGANWILDTDYIYDDVTISKYNTNTLKVTFTHPIPNFLKNNVILSDLTVNTQLRAKAIIEPQTQIKSECLIRFYDESNATVNLDDISEVFSFSVLMI